VTPAGTRSDGNVSVTVTGTHLGTGSDITAVTVGSARATIQSQSADGSSVVVVVPPANGQSGTVPLVVQSVVYGNTSTVFTYFAGTL